MRNHRVIAVSCDAAKEGVAVGLRRREAQARCPEIVLVEEDLARDARAFEPVVSAIRDLVPLVEVVEPGTVLFATRGPSRWCGGDQALAERIWLTVASALGPLGALLAPARSRPGRAVAGPGIGVGIGDGRFAASIAARCSWSSERPVLFATGASETAAMLAEHDVSVLHEVAGVPFELIDLFRRLGLRRLGDVATLDTRSVHARFGPDGAFSHRLACGYDERPPNTTVPPPELSLTVTFDDPVNHVDTVVFSAKQLAQTMFQSLAERGQICTKLLVEAETEHGEHNERCWHRTEGLSASAMVERVRWQLDGWVRQPGGLSGGVVMLRLTPKQARADCGRQPGFWGESTQADEWAAKAIARVSGLLGPESVRVPEWQGGRNPDDRYRWVPAAAVDVVDVAARRSALSAPAGPWPGALPAPSPTSVCVSPVSIDVIDDEGQRVGVDGRGGLSASPATVVIDGKKFKLDAWAGPWPVDERWWDPHRRRRRARFQFLTDTGAALLASVERGGWWLEARYD
jgi:protein ImuB